MRDLIIINGKAHSFEEYKGCVPPCEKCSLRERCDEVKDILCNIMDDNDWGIFVEVGEVELYKGDDGVIRSMGTYRHKDYIKADIGEVILYVDDHNVKHRLKVVERGHAECNGCFFSKDGKCKDIACYDGGNGHWVYFKEIQE